jgi:hypothetical protein
MVLLRRVLSSAVWVMARLRFVRSTPELEVLGSKHPSRGDIPSVWLPHEPGDDPVGHGGGRFPPPWFKGRIEVRELRLQARLPDSGLSSRAGLVSGHAHSRAQVAPPSLRTAGLTMIVLVQDLEWRPDFRPQHSYGRSS